MEHRTIIIFQVKSSVNATKSYESGQQFSSDKRFREGSESVENDDRALVILVRLVPTMQSKKFVKTSLRIKMKGKQRFLRTCISIKRQYALLSQRIWVKEWSVHLHMFHNNRIFHAKLLNSQKQYQISQIYCNWRRDVVLSMWSKNNAPEYHLEVTLQKESPKTLKKNYQKSKQCWSASTMVYQELVTHPLTMSFLYDNI